MYTNNEILENEYRNTIPFIIRPQRSNTWEYTQVYSKEVKDLYAKNYKTLIKEFKDVHKLKVIPYAWIRKINIVKMAIVPKAIYRFNAIPIKQSMIFFTELEQTIQHFIRNQKYPESPK